MLSLFQLFDGIRMSLRSVLFVLTLCVAAPAFADPPATPASVPASATAAPDTAPAVVPTPVSSPVIPSPSATGASVSDPYISATWAELMRTMVRFNAIDLHDDNLIDEYAAVTDCEIYKTYYKDDFKWNEIRNKLRESTTMEMIKYPAHYYFYTVLKLDRYDFAKSSYLFTRGTAIDAVNVFRLFETFLPMCDNKIPSYVPKTFQAVADKPFTMLGLPLAPADAQAILRQMTADKNTKHTIVVKFNMTVTYIDRLRKTAVGSRADTKAVDYQQALDNPPPVGTLRMDVHLDSVDFYEDGAMTKLVYSAKL